jgi:hypothetical protein
VAGVGKDCSGWCRAGAFPSGFMGHWASKPALQAGLHCTVWDFMRNVFIMPLICSVAADDLSMICHAAFVLKYFIQKI